MDLCLGLFDTLVRIIVVSHIKIFVVVNNFQDFARSGKRGCVQLGPRKLPHISKHSKIFKGSVKLVFFYSWIYQFLVSMMQI
ncbi:hypothetical protein PHAVU_010G041300, partial [Phaseolus vulgaris]